MPRKEILAQFWGDDEDCPLFPNLELDSIQLFKVHEDLPGLESLDDSLSSSCSSDSLFSDNEPSLRRSSRRQKRVSFSKAEIREYAVVVGDHPLCEDGLPISLDWKHTQETKVIDLAIGHDSSLDKRLSSLRRLSYDDRVERLRSVSGMTTEDVIQEETNLVCSSMRDMWSDFAKDLTFSFDAIENHLRKVYLAEAGKRHNLV